MQPVRRTHTRATCAKGASRAHSGRTPAAAAQRSNRHGVNWRIASAPLSCSHVFRSPSMHSGRCLGMLAEEATRSENPICRRPPISITLRNPATYSALPSWLNQVAAVVPSAEAEQTKPHSAGFPRWPDPRRPSGRVPADESNAVAPERAGRRWRAPRVRRHGRRRRYRHRHRCRLRPMRCSLRERTTEECAVITTTLPYASR